MAFENVNVDNLKSALNSCKNSINYSISKSLISSISNRNVWQSDSKMVLKNALDTLVNTRYRDLKNKISDYQTAVKYIEEYQELKKKNQSLTAENSRLSSKLYYEETYYTYTYDSEGNKESHKNTRTVKNYTVEKQINNNKSQINSNETRLDSLVNKVSALI